MRILFIVLMMMVLAGCDIPEPTPAPLIIPSLHPADMVSATDFQNRVMRLAYPQSWLARVGNRGEIVLANRQNALGAWDENIFALRRGEFAGVVIAVDENSIIESWRRNLESVMANSRAQLTRYRDMQAQFMGNAPFSLNGREGLFTIGTLTRDEKQVDVMLIVVQDPQTRGYASMLLGASLGQMQFFEALLLEIAGTFEFIRQE